MVLLCLLAHARVGDGALTAAQLEDVRRTHCRNGTLSMTAVCNTTFRSYPTGCPSSVEQRRCAAPLRGSRCSEIPNQNLTCLTPFKCGSLEVPANSRLTVRNPNAMETVAITCNSGYEYYAQGESRGFSGEVDCLETGNFSEIRPADFACQPVECGLFCRYCADAAPTRLTVTDGEWEEYRSWGWKDRFGPCCMERSPPLEDGSNADFLPNRLRNAPLRVKLKDDSVTKAIFPDALALECVEASVGQVPGSGKAAPRCIPRPGCVYNAANNPPWSPPACEHVRGMYEPGMTCNFPASAPMVAQYEIYDPATNWTVDQGCKTVEHTSECEFPIRVRVRLATNENEEHELLWTFASGSPVTEWTSEKESTAANGAAAWTGDDLVISSVSTGCMVFNKYQTLRAVVVAPGKPNSEELVTPVWKVTATPGTLPEKLPTCPDAAGAPKTGCDREPTAATMNCVIHYCSDNPDVTTKAACPDNWVPKPPLKVTTCSAYRYFVFQPEALAAKEADAYALSEIRFFYRDRQVLPAAVSRYGLHPAAEASNYVADGSLDTKVLQLDRCALEFDFGRQVAVDEYELGTANDCNSRDPVRWKIFASNDRVLWVQVFDQSTISFSMPNDRTTATPRIPIPLLRPEGLQMIFSGVVVTESTTVPDALNTITMTFGVKYIVACPPSSSVSECYRTDTQGNEVVQAPPLGTVIHVGGFPDARTPPSTRCRDVSVYLTVHTDTWARRNT